MISIVMITICKGSQYKFLSMDALFSSLYFFSYFKCYMSLYYFQVMKNDENTFSLNIYLLFIL